MADYLSQLANGVNVPGLSAGSIQLPGLSVTQTAAPRPLIGPPIPTPAPKPVVAAPVYKPAAAPPDFSNPSGFQQRKAGSLYLGYNPGTGQAIAFTDQNQFNKYFKGFDTNAAAPEFDYNFLLSAPNQVLGIPQPKQAAAIPSAPAAPVDPNQALAEAAARAGLSLDDYLKLVSAQNGASTGEKDQIRQDLGIPDLEQSVFTPPSKTTEQLYTDAYNSSGLGEIKTKLADLDSRIADIKAKYTSKAGDINENPFLSEASRIGRQGRLTAQQEAEVGNLTDEYNSYANLYAQGLSEVNGLITRSSADFQTNQSLNAQKLEYLLKKADDNVAALEKTKGGGSLSYVPNFLDLKAKATAPDTIGSAETGFFAWNPTNGKFEQVTEPQPKMTEDQSDYLVYLQQGGDASFIDFKRELSNLKATSSGGGSIGTQLANTMKMLQIQQLQQTLAGNKPLSGEAAKISAIATTIVPEIQQLKDKFNADYKGSVAGIVTGTNRELSKLVDQVADKIGRIRSGGAINTDEASRFRGQIASWKDLIFGNKDQAIAALDGILSEAIQVQTSIRPYDDAYSSAISDLNFSF